MESECSGVFLLAAGEVNQHQRWTKLSQRDGLSHLGYGAVAGEHVNVYDSLYE